MKDKNVLANTSKWHYCMLLNKLHYLLIEGTRHLTILQTGSAQLHWVTRAALRGERSERWGGVQEWIEDTQIHYRCCSGGGKYTASRLAPLHTVHTCDLFHYSRANEPIREDEGMTCCHPEQEKKGEKGYSGHLDNDGYRRWCLSTPAVRTWTDISFILTLCFFHYSIPDHSCSFLLTSFHTGTSWTGLQGY